MDIASLLQQSGFGGSAGGAPTPGGSPMGGMGAMDQPGLIQLLMQKFGGGPTSASPPKATGLPPGVDAPMGGPSPSGGPAMGMGRPDQSPTFASSPDATGLPPGVSAPMGGPDPMPPPGAGMGRPDGQPLGAGSLAGAGPGMTVGNTPGPAGPSPMMKGAGAFGNSIGKGLMAQSAPKPMSPPSGNISPFQPPQYRPPGRQMGQSPYQNPFAPVR